MKGRIRPVPGEKCPKCSGPFRSIEHPLMRGEQIDILCPSCLTRPLRVYIDCRGVRDRRGEAIGNLFKNERGEPFSSFHLAHLTLSMIRQQLKEGILDSRSWQPEKTRKYILSELAAEYVSVLFRGKRSRGHVEQAERVLEKLQVVFGDKDVRGLLGNDLLELDKVLVKEGCSPATRKKYLQHIQAFVRWFNKYHLPHSRRIEVPPLPLIGKERKEIGWIDWPEQEEVLKAIKYENLHLAYRILFETGARIGEVCGLKTKDLVRNEGVPGIYVQRSIDMFKKVKGTKTGTWMFKPVSEELFQQLIEICRKKFPEDWIFTTRYGNPYSPGRLSKVWHQASKDVGLNISLYAACRHSRATRKLIDLQKEMVKEVQKTLGHESAKTVQRHYIRPIDERRHVRKCQKPADKGPQLPEKTDLDKFHPSTNSMAR